MRGESDGESSQDNLLNMTAAKSLEVLVPKGIYKCTYIHVIQIIMYIIGTKYIVYTSNIYSIVCTHRQGTEGALSSERG